MNKLKWKLYRWLQKNLKQEAPEVGTANWWQVQAGWTLFITPDGRTWRMVAAHRTVGDKLYGYGQRMRWPLEIDLVEHESLTRESLL